MGAPIETFYSGLGKRIRDARTRRRLTQEQLGAALVPATTRVSIANVESGKQRVLAPTLVQFAAALQVDVAELLPLPSVHSSPTKHDIALELVSKAGLSKAEAKKILEKN